MLSLVYGTSGYKKYTGCLKNVPVNLLGTRFKARNCIREPGLQEPYRDILGDGEIRKLALEHIKVIHCLIFTDWKKGNSYTILQKIALWSNVRLLYWPVSSNHDTCTHIADLKKVPIQLEMCLLDGSVVIYFSSGNGDHWPEVVTGTSCVGQKVSLRWLQFSGSCCILGLYIAR
jgi:hypothetical protein